MIPHGNSIKIFTGNSNPKLASDICTMLGQPLGDANLQRFSDGEIAVSINESVRGSDVFLVQSTCEPVNDHLMELLIMIDALQPGFRRPHHRGDALFRLCPPGPQGQGP